MQNYYFDYYQYNKQSYKSLFPRYYDVSLTEPVFIILHFVINNIDISINNFINIAHSDIIL